MSRFAVILPAAGKSTRFSAQKRKKPFVELKGRPIWVRTAEHFVSREDVAQTLIVISPDDLDWFKEKFRPNLAFMEVELVTGGKERADSVENALARVHADVDFVAVHDAARPLLTAKWINEVFKEAERCDAAIPGIPVTSTLKKVQSAESTGNLIQATVPRDQLWLAQTPQVFRRDLLLEAYAKRGDCQATDEASLVEKLGHPVKVVPGSPMNLKITTYDDFKMAEALVDALPKDDLFRPLHPFADDNPHLFS
jgi:2-C-methyl-D-erythritol 4-phosphate cytidylyltransferase